MIEEDSKTLWCGNLPEQATEELIYELFLQAGPLERVKIPRDRDGRQKNFAFITYCHDVSVPYALSLFRGTALFHRTLSLQCRGRMPLLPPPIRCYGPEVPFDTNQVNFVQQFSEMADKLRDCDNSLITSARQAHDINDKLVMASLQGNWQNRHHPYRPKEKNSGRDDLRAREHRDLGYRNNNRFKQDRWRDRPRGNYQRRD